MLRTCVVGAFGIVIMTGSAQPQTPIDVATLAPEAAAVHKVWQEYLASKQGHFQSRAGVPSPHWVESEQKQWPVYDLAAYYLLDDAVPEVIGIDRVDSADGDGYRITTRFRHRDQNARPATWWTSLTVTVYAVQEGGRWRLTNALPRHTRGWHRETVGPIMYVFAPDYPYDAARARRAVAFADSIADAFALPRLAPLTYYLTSSVDEVYRIMGLQSAVKFGQVGGAAQPVNRMLFSGLPSVGEEYRHELAHLILAPLCCAKTSYFISEGVPTWLGGTTGMDFTTAARGLATFLAERPSVSLDSLMSGSFQASQLYPAGAVLTAMVFDHGGVAAVKALFTGGPTPEQLRATLERLLQRPWAAVVEDWHRRAMAFTAR